MAVNRASLVQVQPWMGHAHIRTTARYLHAKSQVGDAALLAARSLRPPQPRNALTRTRLTDVYDLCVPTMVTT
jgi:hypothetical protein